MNPLTDGEFWKPERYDDVACLTVEEDNIQYHPAVASYCRGREGRSQLTGKVD
jgi:hypothetical protein